MLVLGYFLSILIGVSLGLMGGGGSILTVPLLVYFFDVDPLLATSYSLFIVGFTSLIGIPPYIRDRNINRQLVLSFGIPSVLAVFSTTYFLVPILPEKFEFSTIVLKRDFILLLFFSLILIVSSFSMVGKKNLEIKETPFSSLKLLITGLVTGCLTGIIGIGGGFLIVPALVKASKIPIKKAIGTSLLIIVMNAFIGLLAMRDYSKLDFELLISILFFALLGMILGVRLARKIDGNTLKVFFGWFILILAILILVSEMCKVFY
ncbi:MAG: sulfite exporter TauE/SafE family protein [Bacteroidota bacterium]